ncbi:hypothetical protein ACWFQ7_13085 [Streptomyces bacillaris]|uniref:hypothetical protein n=1 Tax=Streptomyces cavourensis TaxID=67258 RepID=UPI002277A390|nr:hypothetical protein [Streptomyces cavourensis]WAE65973.1 hypothetical protein OUQ49_09545 [Streptomyces cavourensis]
MEPHVPTARTEKAIAWARQHLGTESYASRCLAFVEDAYERPNELELFGGDFAAESAELYSARENAAAAARRMQAARFGDGTAAATG